jgi:2'-hydroxyisoflavone reductase
VQVIDARDLAPWMIAMAEKRAAGVYNATSPRFRFDRVLEACRAVAPGDPRFVWVDADFLLKQGVEPWSELPLWAPAESMKGLMQIDVSKAMESGLAIRSLEETARDTLEWSQGLDRPIDRAGLARDREVELLAAIKSV